MIRPRAYGAWSCDLAAICPYRSMPPANTHDARSAIHLRPSSRACIRVSAQPHASCAKLSGQTDPMQSDYIRVSHWGSYVIGYVDREFTSSSLVLAAQGCTRTAIGCRISTKTPTRLGSFRFVAIAVCSPLAHPNLVVVHRDRIASCLLRRALAAVAMPTPAS